MNYETISVRSLEDYLYVMKQFVKDGINIRDRKKNWINLILANKLVCPSTGLKVAYCGYDRQTFKNGESSYHYNFYSSCGRLFTIDHIIPLSKGGKKTDINNIQPMIAEYNFDKQYQLNYDYTKVIKPTFKTLYKSQSVLEKQAIKDIEKAVVSLIMDNGKSFSKLEGLEIVERQTTYTVRGVAVESKIECIKVYVYSTKSNNKFKKLILDNLSKENVEKIFFFLCGLKT